MPTGYDTANTRKIGYVMLGDTDKVLASTRITILNTLDLVRENGYKPIILDKSSFYDPFREMNGIVDKAMAHGFGEGDVVYLQSMRSKSAVEAANRFRSMGIKTIFGVCNFIDPIMAETCDATVVPSQRLKECYPSSLQNKIHVVHDGIEFPDVKKKDYNIDGNLNAVFLTGKKYNFIPGLYIHEDVDLTVIGPYGLNNQQSFRIPRGHEKTIGVESPSGLKEFRKEVWTIDAYKRIADFDIGVLPIDLSEKMPRPDQAPTHTRSSNKLTQMMSAGLTVIAGPLPTYFDIIEQGVNGFIVETPEEWVAAFEALKSTEVRERMGRAARESVKNKFSLESQVAKLLRVVESI
ncbi:glycosyltransferase family 4 protein [Candidatus Woesearchaeota archaeon]|nr:glycosyltransferase family 4 protein [Candidatus Woesearchaeota archaeon]MBT5272520.1 glycosyltransferase family 4 protein [Candidatus Woesearchaeota archaeon]MBT6041472.1 glycosyltransferase family 4 protein [Candidatus Woesearchaeota archaeon]MBT6336382.1 glycosyltransferase family 4 protein [Candidatus Woesearchaeota archaeon]MBT7927703.1 glycosyltransferase family 4 protein [Candidatus Woesearchaeota archaeon]